MLEEARNLHINIRDRIVEEIVKTGKKNVSGKWNLRPFLMFERDLVEMKHHLFCCIEEKTWREEDFIRWWYMNEYEICVGFKHEMYKFFLEEFNRLNKAEGIKTSWSIVWEYGSTHIEPEKFVSQKIVSKSCPAPSICISYEYRSC